jgi:hypothetical protein
VLEEAVHEARKACSALRGQKGMKRYSNRPVIRSCVGRGVGGGGGYTVYTYASTWRGTLEPLPSFLFVRCSLFVCMARLVEGLYCTRPIQCLATSELLSPHPLVPWRVCTPPPHPPLVLGEDTLARGRGGGGSVIRKTPCRNCSVLYIYM